jgi:hypothetical protein
VLVVYFDLEAEWLIVFNGNCSREHSTAFGIYFFHSFLNTWRDIFLSPGGKVLILRTWNSAGILCISG